MRRHNSVETRRRRGKRMMVWMIVGFVLAVVLAPIPFYLFGDAAVAQTEATEEANVRANFWREVRKGTAGYTAVTGQEANVLIQNGGENWRALRNGPIAIYGAWIVAGSLLSAGLFFLIRGPVKLDRERTGMTIQRWNTFERVLHWYTASLFIILAITGLSLLYGRTVLIPLFGKDGFAAFAALAKDIHNYLGPLFAVGLLVEILIWIKDNIPKAHDLTWLKQGGGVVGSGLPPAGRMNAGEKLWFWLLCTVGMAVVIAGFVLDFPNFGQTRDQMQLAHLVHVAGALILTAVAFGHIYLGTIGTEGAFEGMAKGRVDVAWLEQHHNLWYEELVQKGVQPEPVSSAQPPTGGARAEPRST